MNSNKNTKLLFFLTLLLSPQNSTFAMLIPVVTKLGSSKIKPQHLSTETPQDLELRRQKLEKRLNTIVAKFDWKVPRCDLKVEFDPALEGDNAYFMQPPNKFHGIHPKVCVDSTGFFIPPKNEQDWTLGHEAAHYHQREHQWLFSLTEMPIVHFTRVSAVFDYLYCQDPVSTGGMLLCASLMNLGIKKLRRHYELDADAQACKVLSTTDGALASLSKLQKKLESQKPTIVGHFAQKFPWFKKLLEMHQDHPSVEKRIQALEKLKHDLE